MNRKWWRFILFLDVVAILINAYIIYIYIHNMHGTTRKNKLSHHDFRKSIACAWVNRKNTVHRNLKFSQKSQLQEEK